MTYFFIMTSLTFHGLKIVFGTDCFRVLSSRHFFRFNLIIQIKMQHCEDETLWHFPFLKPPSPFPNEDRKTVSSSSSCVDSSYKLFCFFYLVPVTYKQIKLENAVKYAVMLIYALFYESLGVFFLNFNFPGISYLVSVMWYENPKLQWNTPVLKKNWPISWVLAKIFFSTTYM